jgi:Na+/H+ antiporter NhaD/arsenite permease-like protein
MCRFSLLASAGATLPFEPGIGWVVFFVLLLLAIAVLPLYADRWWEVNSNKAIVTAALSLPVAAYYAVAAPGELLHPVLEYFSFIVLLWSLYSISGGIVLRGSLEGTPKANTVMLAIGAVAANFLGTTGAAMILIRPLLRMNEHRQQKKHVVIFFIFLVANIGGCLTPLGDPPLFLGFLRGVPFAWTLQLFPIWLGTLLPLLVIFYFWDRRAFGKESRAVRKHPGGEEKVRLVGTLNLLFLSGVLTATLLSSHLEAFVQATGLGWGSGSPWREAIMILMGLLSLRFTAKRLRADNKFSFDAIAEVAILFAGIFLTMIPALSLLSIHGGELGLTEPWQFMWATGTLSSFLDNAPTYLVFATAATGVAGATPGAIAELTTSAVGIPLLKAVCIGAVFMGANTYIGNAPNFMVKVIAETAKEQRVKMPSFFGYMLYSVGILVPLFVLVSLVAFVWLKDWL